MGDKMNYNGKYSLKRRYLIKESARTAAGASAQYQVAKAILGTLGGQYYAQVIRAGSQDPDLTIHDMKGTKVAQVEVKSNSKHQVPLELSVYDNVATLTGYQAGGRAGVLTAPHDSDPKVQALVAKMSKDKDSSGHNTPSLPVVSDGAKNPRDHQLQYIEYVEGTHTGLDDVSRLRHRSVRGGGKLGGPRLSNWLVKIGKGQLTNSSCPTPKAFKAAILKDVSSHSPVDDYYATKAGSEIKISSIAGTNSVIPTVQIDPSIPKYVCSGYGAGNANTSRDVIDADVHGPAALTLSASGQVPSPIPEIPVDPQTGQFSPAVGGIYYSPLAGYQPPTPAPDETQDKTKLADSFNRWLELTALMKD